MEHAYGLNVPAEARKSGRLTRLYGGAAAIEGREPGVVCVTASAPQPWGAGDVPMTGADTI